MNAPRFASPASTTLDEFVQLRGEATALQRRTRLYSEGPNIGELRSRRLGRGLDFAELREYQAGDDVRLIDWKVTARTGRPHTKLFVEERERPVYLLIDFRASMRFATRGCYKSALASRLAAIVGWSAIQARDRVGGVVFTDDWFADIRPQGGRKGLMRLLHSVLHGQKRIPRGTGVGLADMLERVATVAHPGSAIRIFSDFNGLDARCAKLLGDPLARQDVVGVHVVDPIDRELPRGRLPVIAMPAIAQPGVGKRLMVGGQTQRREHRARHRAEVEQLTAMFSHGRHALLSVTTSDTLLDNAARVLDAAGTGPQPARARARRGVAVS